MTFDFPAAYDELNPADNDYKFYADLATRLKAACVIDLGCETGTLARLLAANGHHVIGIDPRPRVHDEEIGTTNVEVYKLLHHSLGLNSIQIQSATGALTP